MLTPAMSARNRKKRKLAIKLLHHSVQGAALFVWFHCRCFFWFTGPDSLCVDLGFTGELPTDWTGCSDPCCLCMCLKGLVLNFEYYLLSNKCIHCERFGLALFIARFMMDLNFVQKKVIPCNTLTFLFYVVYALFFNRHSIFLSLLVYALIFSRHSIF